MTIKEARRTIIGCVNFVITALLIISIGILKCYNQRNIMNILLIPLIICFVIYIYVIFPIFKQNCQTISIIKQKHSYTKKFKKYQEKIKRN